ncbi:hypothetical protein [Microseira wollei]|uniref:Uncharacterized protein n=1 Tax=Microseira wollei NIES-4236 TaxID=2530354 RepID=A0AAV3XFK6_9CYAN|nr:hypothetical protein [Microseira wollei]GET40216.1 hypothetical protein MiSe_50250 [Microseira wollei NIES-4236]
MLENQGKIFRLEPLPHKPLMPMGTKIAARKRSNPYWDWILAWVKIYGVDRAIAEMVLL